MIKLTFTQETLPKALKEFAGDADDKGNFTVEVIDAKTHNTFLEDLKTVKAHSADSEKTLTVFKEIAGDKELSDFKTYVESLKETQQKVDDGKLQTSSEIQEATEERVSKVVKGFERQADEFEAQNRESEKTISGLQKELEAGRVDTAFMAASLSLPTGITLKPAFSGYVQTEIKEKFRFDEETKTIKGFEMNQTTGRETPLINSKGAPLSMTEYLLQVYEEKPTMFEEPTGGGARDSTLSGSLGYTNEEFSNLSPEEKVRVGLSL